MKIYAQEVKGDLSEKDAWIKALHHKNRWFRLIAARSLSRLGVAEALPDFDWLEDHSSDYPANIKIWRARLVVEAEGKSAGKTTEATAQAKLDRFFAELQVSPQYLNDEIKKFDEVRRTWVFKQDEVPVYPASFPSAELTMYEVSDMIYHSDNPSAWFKLPQVKALDFALSLRSSLKVRWASVPIRKRPQLMAEELSKPGATPLTLMQMMAELGKPAREAVAEKIEEVYLRPVTTNLDEKQEQEKVAAHHWLFKFLADSGDKAYEPLMERMVLNKRVGLEAWGNLSIRGPKIFDPGLGD